MIRAGAIAIVAALAAPAAARPGPTGSSGMIRHRASAGTVRSGGYSIVLPADVMVAERAETRVSLTIAPEPGRTISRKGPIRVSLAAEPADGLELPRKRYRRADAADALADSPRFDLAVRGRRAGKHRLLVSVRFWLCGRATCWPVAAERSVAVEVTAAP